MKKITAILALFLFIDSELNAQCFDPGLLDSIFCDTTYAPVCGCDGVTYFNDCYATAYFGISYFTPGVCPPDTFGLDTCANPASGLSSFAVWDSAGGSFGLLGYSLSWNSLAPDGVIAYRVQGRPSSGSSWTTLPGPIFEPTTFTFVPASILTPGTTYDWRVQSSCFPLGTVLAPNSAPASFSVPLLREEAMLERFNIETYPNPASDQLMIRSEADIDVFDYEIFDLSGKLLLAQQNYTVDQALDISTLQAGIYILQLNIDGLQEQRQFVVE
jgi:hypothetical protein